MVTFSFTLWEYQSRYINFESYCIVLILQKSNGFFLKSSIQEKFIHVLDSDKINS